MDKLSEVRTTPTLLQKEELERISLQLVDPHECRSFRFSFRHDANLIQGNALSTMQLLKRAERTKRNKKHGHKLLPPRLGRQWQAFLVAV